MNLFFAYALAVCPAINDLICGLMIVCTGIMLLLGCFVAQEEEDSNAIKTALKAIVWLFKVLLLLTILWVLVPSQKQLNAMMLNYHATYDARNDYGVPQGDK